MVFALPMLVVFPKGVKTLVARGLTMGLMACTCGVAVLPAPTLPACPLLPSPTLANFAGPCQPTCPPPLVWVASLLAQPSLALLPEAPLLLPESAPPLAPDLPTFPPQPPPLPASMLFFLVASLVVPLLAPLVPELQPPPVLPQSLQSPHSAAQLGHMLSKPPDQPPLWPQLSCWRPPLHANFFDGSHSQEISFGGGASSGAGGSPSFCSKSPILLTTNLALAVCGMLPGDRFENWPMTPSSILAFIASGLM
mmetsp:Transcript_55367/g.154218  ORF Transcript_55367/g.154218 Transcript_55367/m.154218 type:complete len:252 (-) Transcript_55367:567-1322(-)